MNWKQLVNELDRSVPSGHVTTYAEVSYWGYGTRNHNQPVRSLLTGAANHGHQRLTNRVVKTDGRLANLPEGSDQQKQQLVDEGVPFAANGKVDFDRIAPVRLT